MSIIDSALNFLSSPANGVGLVENERSLQLELGMLFRNQGYNVRFEASAIVPAHPQQTKRQKRDIDLLIDDGVRTCAIELKVPLAGRVPETMYDFFADIAFIESVVQQEIADQGLCILVTNNAQFWDGREQSGIYEPLRLSQSQLTGKYQKPTGSKESSVFIQGTYPLTWKPVIASELLPNAKFTRAVVA